MSYYSTTVLADSPVGYWRLGEASGTVAADINAGTKHNGTIGSSVTYGVTGPLHSDTDTAMTFGGNTNSVVDIASGTTLYYTTGSIEAWVKTTQAGGYFTIFGRDNCGSMYLNGNTLRAYDFGGGGDRNSGVTINDGKWHHVALTWQNGVAGGSQLYVDGAAAGAAFLLSGMSSGTGSHLMVANELAGGGFLIGSVDEPAIYSTVLSAAQILAHYKAGLTWQGTCATTSSTSLTVTGTLAAAGTCAIASVTSVTATGTLAGAAACAITSTTSVTATGTMAIAGTCAILSATSVTATGTDKAAQHGDTTGLGGDSAGGGQVASTRRQRVQSIAGACAIVSITTVSAEGTVAHHRELSGVASISTRTALTVVGSMSHQWTLEERNRHAVLYSLDPALAAKVYSKAA